MAKTENRIGYQIRKRISVFYEYRNQVLKNGKSANRSEPHKNRKTEVFLAQKLRKWSKK